MKNSRIVFQTEPEKEYIDYNVPVYVGVGNIIANRTLSCVFTWQSSITPYLYSVTPSVIRGRTNLTITGDNLLTYDRVYSDIHLSINDVPCTVTGANKTSVNCSIDAIEAGVHRIIGYIDGI